MYGAGNDTIRHVANADRYDGSFDDLNDAEIRKERGGDSKRGRESGEGGP